MKKLNILFVTTELRGMVSIGGLGEFVLSLSCTLRKRGHDVRIAMPYYEYLNSTHQTDWPRSVWKGKLSPDHLPETEVFITSISAGGYCIPVYLVKGHSRFLEAITMERIYAPQDDPASYFYFSNAILEFLSDESTTWCPDIIHCNDYHTGLIAVFLRFKFGGSIGHKKVNTFFTIHNLGFQGITSPDILEYAGLPRTLGGYSPYFRGMEFYGKINCMKGAIIYSDMCTTVSQTYAKEIQTPELGMGLNGILKIKSGLGKLKGILNGIDNETWDPRKLGELAFDYDHLEGKTKSKNALRQQCGLEMSSDPVIAFRSRWSPQKGIGLLITAFRKYEIYKKAQFVVVSRRENAAPDCLPLWDELSQWSAAYPERISFQPDASITAELQYAGSDMLVMPSLYEPCGLVPMEAMRYGVVVIGNRTGGIIDMLNDENGFMFDWHGYKSQTEDRPEEGAGRMVQVMNRACNVYYADSAWQHRVKKVMQQDNSWTGRVSSYLDLYWTMSSC